MNNKKSNAAIPSEIYAVVWSNVTDRNNNQCSPWHLVGSLSLINPNKHSGAVLQMMITAPNDLLLCVYVLFCWLCFFLILRFVSGARPRRSLSPSPTFPVVVGVLPISSGWTSVVHWLGCLREELCLLSSSGVKLLSSPLTYRRCLPCLVTLSGLKRYFILLLEGNDITSHAACFPCKHNQPLQCCQIKSKQSWICRFIYSRLLRLMFKTCLTVFACVSSH